MRFKGSLSPSGRKGQEIDSCTYLSIMNISLDKALLWSLPYLYLVAIFYYWGYWGTFEIDAINYYPISDLVKGVTARFASTLLWTICYFLIWAAYWYFLNSDWAEKNQNRIRRPVLILGCIAFVTVISVAVLSMRSNPESQLRQSSPAFFRQLGSTTIPFMITTLTALGLEVYHASKRNAEKNSLRFLTSMLMLWLLCIAFTSGKNNAWAIIDNQNFEYVVMQDGLMKNGVYKYLGKAGDSLFFITLDNSKHIIATAASINPITIEHYLNDQASQKQFRINLRMLSSASTSTNANSTSTSAVH